LLSPRQAALRQEASGLRWTDKASFPQEGTFAFYSSHLVYCTFHKISFFLCYLATTSCVMSNFLQLVQCGRLLNTFLVTFQIC
jgi:hypothetical protein